MEFGFFFYVGLCKLLLVLLVDWCSLKKKNLDLCVCVYVLYYNTVLHFVFIQWKWVLFEVGY